MPTTDPSITVAALNAASQGINAVSTGTMHRANRRQAEKMFQWEVDTARENWRRQNEYNSPLQQMQRLKEAGLNPNLVYGNGAVAQGGSIASSSASAPPGQAPQFDLGGIVSGYLDAESKKVQIDNAKEVQKNLATERLLKEAQIGKINQDVINNVWDLERRKGLAPYQLTSLRTSIDQQLANIQNTNARTDLTKTQIPQVEAQTNMIIDSNARAAQMQPYNIRKIVQDTAFQLQNTLQKEYQNKNLNQFQLLQIKRQIELIDKNMKNIDSIINFRDLQAELQKMVNAGQDPRIIGDMFKGLVGDIFKGPKIIKNLFFKK
jgi:hypothetical protein